MTTYNFVHTCVGKIPLDRPERLGETIPELTPPVWAARVAGALARIARFSGNARPAPSVLAHSIAVMDYTERFAELPPATRLLALLHDCTEIVIGDIPKPVRDRFAPGLAEFERRALESVLRHLGHDPADADREIVREADNYVTRLEAQQFLDGADWAGAPTRDWHTVRFYTYPVELLEAEFTNVVARERRK